ncbi:sarcosine oxidase subunit gamma [Cypionkella sp.]|uniref:sarcosine oxidase subunit gamma n=1 Tax=Cypionkella sp. TaxID=2811411 RepID=UPI002724F949|nr:sarcosine oxidase subunit gamma [Cypionkella sp.]MDO8984223.1 sarcosine oxidase subunit gamma [Cypionkella sp.]MDP2047896.1 sarcosine oxidase subunit gamma [Cypionkella sp.]
MANPLKSLTPLGHDAPITETIGAVTIAENIGTALASLASRLGREAEVASAAKTASIPLPGPGCAESATTYGAIWLGPEQWMVEAPFATHEDIASVLKPIFGETASITEQTDAWVRFDVTASDLPALFERLCSYDLRKAGAGAATRTVIDHLGCYVIARTETEVSILGPRSSAHSLHHALTTAAKATF